MTCRSWTTLTFLLGIVVSLQTTSWTQDKVLPSTSSVCASPATDSNGTAGNFYVAVTGDDSNPGTINLPWRTIQHAANTVEAGETVYIRGGIYHESVDLEVSGSAAAGPVTFQNYPPETAILDGTGLAPPISDIRGLINIEDQSYVTIRGLEIRNFQTTSASSTPAGIYVTGAGSQIKILNNVVHNIATMAEASGDAAGIVVYGSEAPDPLANIAISGNQLYDLKTGNSESVTVSGNVTNFAITCNVVHDTDNKGIAAIGFEEVAPDLAFDYARNGTISRNTLYNVSAKNNPAGENEYSAGAISVDGASQIVIEDNRLEGIDIGIEIASLHKGRAARDLTVRNNLVYHANSSGISIGGDSANSGVVDRATIVKNTLSQNDSKNTGSGELQIQYHANNIVFKNNIVSANSQGLLVNSYVKESANSADLDYNLYFSPVAASDADFLWRGKDYDGFAAYQAATGKDPHSKYADPKVQSVETPDLRIRPALPAAGSGIAER